MTAAVVDVLLFAGQELHAPTVPLAAYVPYPHNEHTPPFM